MADVITKKEPEFKKLSELRREDVAKLGKVPFTVTTKRTKYGTTYSGTIPFGKGHLRFNLDETSVLLIAEVRKMDVVPVEFTVQAFIRYVVGMDKNDNEYHQAQVLVGTNCYFTSLISQRELTLMELWINNGKMEKINWVKCPSKDVEAGLGFFED